MTDKGLNFSDIGGLDKQIETLLECKPLSEQAVKQLCEKVINQSIFGFVGWNPPPAITLD